MLQSFFAGHFETALIQLKNEMNSYTHKENVWKLEGQIKNSGGTLCLHLLGNLNHFIGAVLGNSGYVRQREHEFADRNVPTGQLMKEIDELIYRVKTIISGLTDEQLNGPYPLNDGKMWKTTSDRLMQLLSHLNYHLGQINYHRRMIEQPVSLPADVEQLAQPNRSSEAVR
ncbi:MAG: DinB family protein [Chitinophagales bacterium]|nr:DinB family protein [Bacteroidota bacterium]MBX7139841.1 DinB family protein [Chitinophagales bacterium]